MGFILAADLPGSGCTEDDVLAATAAFAPAIELIDTRIKVENRTVRHHRRQRLVGWIRVGAATGVAKDVDITGIDAVLTRNGEVVAEGRSDAVLGNPVTAVAWLARKVDGFGVRLRAGDIVLPGSCTGPSTSARAITSWPTSPGWAQFGCL